MKKDLPFEPIGLNREEAAAYVGLGTTKFDEMVGDGRMPKAHQADGRVLWDREELRIAFKNLPRAGEDQKPKPRPLDRMSA